MVGWLVCGGRMVAYVACSGDFVWLVVLFAWWLYLFSWGVLLWWFGCGWVRCWGWSFCWLRWFWGCTLCDLVRGRPCGRVGVRWLSGVGGLCVWFCFSVLVDNVGLRFWYGWGSGRFCLGIGVCVVCAMVLVL